MPQPSVTLERSSARKRPERRGSWADYIPLLVILTVTAMAATARQVDYGSWHTARWMGDFMGLFLVVFSMFKLFDLRKFADGFQMYDLLAKSVRPYAYLYPFLELGLGLGYISRWQPAALAIATIAVFAWGSIGVLLALRKGLDVDCACMGTALKVPLSTVALLENAGMVLMAAFMLIAGIR